MKCRHTPWPRRAKIVRNLVIVFILSLTVWTQLGKPLPYEPSIRRMARQSLVPAMDRHAEITTDLWYQKMRIDWTDGAAMASMYVHPEARPDLYPYYLNAFQYHLTGGPNLVAFPWPVIISDTNLPLSSYAVYAVLFPPEGSAAAALTLHNNSGTYTVTGERDDEIFVFYARPDPDADGGRRMDSSWFFTQDFTYELTFYDETGKEVAVP